MRRPDHDHYFLSLLSLVSARSTCARRSAGAIIVDGHNKILATGYNGVPSGFPHCIDVACPGAEDQHGDNTRCEAIHAEVNAVLQCSRLDTAHTIYISCTPCFSCAKMLCNTPIKRVVCLERYADRTGEALLMRANVEIVVASS